MTQRGMICTRCHTDTGCDPDLSHLPLKYVMEMCGAWLCADCMDEDPEIRAFEEAERTKAATGSKP